MRETLVMAYLPVATLAAGAADHGTGCCTTAACHYGHNLVDVSMPYSGSMRLSGIVV